MKSIWGRMACAIALLFALFLSACTTMDGGALQERRTSSDETDVQKRASIRLQLAAGYYQQKQMDIALDEIKKALAIDPNSADAYNIRAMIYMEIHEMPLAEENFKRALAIAPKNPDLANNYGWFLCQNGQEAKSIPYFEVAYRDHQYLTPIKALNNAALCSLKMKDDKAAEHYLLLAYRMDPSSPMTNTNMAKLYYTRGDYERANFYMTRLEKNVVMSADSLWTAIKIGRKRGDRSAESNFVAQLRRRYPDSPEYSAYQRGAFDE